MAICQTRRERKRTRMLSPMVTYLGELMGDFFDPNLPKNKKKKNKFTDGNLP